MAKQTPFSPPHPSPAAQEGGRGKALLFATFCPSPNADPRKRPMAGKRRNEQKMVGKVHKSKQRRRRKEEEGEEEMLRMPLRASPKENEKCQKAITSLLHFHPQPIPLPFPFLINPGPPPAAATINGFLSKASDLNSGEKRREMWKRGGGRRKRGRWRHLFLHAHKRRKRRRQKWM